MIVIAIIFICATALTLILTITAVSIGSFNNVDDDAVETIVTNNTTGSIVVSSISFVSAS